MRLYEGWWFVESEWVNGMNGWVIDSEVWWVERDGRGGGGLRRVG